MTCLYIKQHRATGLRYFGKTERDVNKYQGSGLYWRNHLKQHGKHVDTIWSEKFTDADMCQEFAEFFSEFFDIVESDAWANLIPEDSKGGGSKKGRATPWLNGKKRPEHSIAMKEKMIGENNPMFGMKLSDEHKKKISQTITGTKNPAKGQPGNQHGKGNLGKIQDAEWRRKKSEAAKANWAMRKAIKEIE